MTRRRRKKPCEGSGSWWSEAASRKRFAFANSTKSRARPSGAHGCGPSAGRGAIASRPDRLANSAFRPFRVGAFFKLFPLRPQCVVARPASRPRGPPRPAAARPGPPLLVAARRCPPYGRRANPRAVVAGCDDAARRVQGLPGAAGRRSAPRTGRPLPIAGRFAQPRAAQQATGRKASRPSTRCSCTPDSGASRAGCVLSVFLLPCKLGGRSAPRRHGVRGCGLRLPGPHARRAVAGGRPSSAASQRDAAGAPRDSRLLFKS